MRASLVTLCVLLILSLGGLAAAAAAVNASRDQVVYEEKTLWGDPAEAEGIVIGSRIDYRYRLFWDITYPLGETPEVVYDFTAVEKRSHSTDSGYSGVLLNGDFSCAMSFSPDAEEQTGLGVVYKRLLDSTPAGEEGREVVRLADYYEYYPISGIVSLPGLSAHWEVERTAWYGGDFPLEVFGEFFRIPVVESERAELHVSRAQGGGGYSIGSRSRYDEEEYDSFYFCTQSAVTENGCYFSFSNTTENGNKVDTSRIPGGYGIYCLPLVPDGQSGRKPDADGLKLWYPLDEAVQFVGLYAEPSGENLLLFTEENGESILTVIRVGTAQPTQRIVLWSDAKNTLRQIFVREEYLLLTGSSGTLQLWEKTPQGMYEKRLDCPQKPDEQYLFYFSTHVSIDWDGERLAVADYLDEFYAETPSFFVSVYRKEGLVYCGEYHSSLAVGYSKESGYYCTPEGGERIVVRFE